MKFQKVNRPPNKNKGECKGTGFSPCMEERGGGGRVQIPKKSEGEGLIPCMGGRGSDPTKKFLRNYLLLKKFAQLNFKFLIEKKSRVCKSS